MRTDKIDQRLYVQDSASLTECYSTTAESLIAELQQYTVKYYNCEVYQNGGDDPTLYISFWRLRTEKELKAYDKQKEKERLAAEKRKTTEKDREMKQLKRLAQKHGVKLI